MMLEKATEFKFNYLEYPGMIEVNLDPTPEMALALAQVNIVTLNAAMEAVTRLGFFQVVLDEMSRDTSSTHRGIEKSRIL